MRSVCSAVVLQCVKQDRVEKHSSSITLTFSNFFRCLLACKVSYSLFTLSCLLGVYAYVTLKENILEDHDSIKKELQAMVKQAIGSFAVPEMIQVYLL